MTMRPSFPVQAEAESGLQPETTASQSPASPPPAEASKGGARLTLPIFSQLLEPEGMAPVQDFARRPELVCARLPSLESRSKLRFVMGEGLQFRLGEKDEVARLLRHWRAALSPQIAETDDAFVSQFGDEDFSDLDSEAPIIRLVNHLFARALDLNASDIHFEPSEHSLDVRCRVDGIMMLVEKLPVKIQSAVASRLKLMARLDIGEKRLPQDGRIDYKVGERQLDMRVSTLPGVLGESIVLRILDRSDLSIDLADLGMPAQVLEGYSAVITQPHGLILITGPTGSGKTTTLYGTLEKIHNETHKIITVEDPVEYQLAGITQIQVNANIGLDFASGLRSIVRQDPDILMIGEIRDHETAEIAIESALTGHLVFSTLHTNDAAGAVTRLQDMGVESYLISSSLLAIQAQRLVRRVCLDCAESVQMSEDEARILGLLPKASGVARQAGEGQAQPPAGADEPDSLAAEAEQAQHGTASLPMIRRGRGCERCGGTGYRGRVGLYELLTMSDEVRHLITSGADANVIRQQAIREGMITLRQDALAKLRQGLTTPEEVVRVTRAL